MSTNSSNERTQNLASAITEVSERASLLVREEIELAKAEVAQKATRIARGAIVAGAAGVFALTALIFILIGCAWFLYWVLPIGGDFTYFYGFFIMAGILLVLGGVAGFVAWKALKMASPPTPQLAIEEARRIKQTVTTPPEPQEKIGA